MGMFVNVRLSVWAQVEVPEYMYLPFGDHPLRQSGYDHDEFNQFLIGALSDPSLPRHASWTFAREESGRLPPEPEPEKGGQP